jgi:Zn-dependent protease
MGWQDRHYNRGGGDSGSFNPLGWLVSGTVPLGTWFGIDVRAHASLVVYIAITLLAPGSFGSWRNAATSMTILFFSVLLHEFGHCFGSKLVGGDPSQIIMHPLGGLAFASAPHRPWPNFITVLAGPMVNLLICIITAAMIAVKAGTWRIVPWNPLNLQLRYLIWGSDFLYYTWWVFIVNYGLLLFNLWPVFPLDGGQMLQSILWAKFGYYRASIFATRTGMIGAVILGIVLGMGSGNFMMIVLAVWGFMTCLNMYRQLMANGPWAYQDEPDYTMGNPSARRRISAKRMRRAQRLEREEAEEQQRIDEILAKVSAHGMHSLTWWEKRALRKATEHQRQRDAELEKSRRQ